MKLSKIGPAFGFVWFVILQSLVSAQVTADFSLDSSNFFSSNARARAAARAAIADLDAALNQNLNAITSADRIISGSFGGETVDFVITARVANPSTGADVTVSAVNARSVIRIFFGARNSLPGGSVAIGGRGSFSFSVPSFTFFNLTNLGRAVNNGVAEVNSVYLRGGGPVTTSISGSVNASLGGG
jgi:hypothetical protein